MFTKVKVTKDFMSLDLLSRDFMSAPHHGGINSFVGVVRNLNLGKIVRFIEYDSYIELCEKIFLEIINEARQRWEEDAHILLFHRIGKVQVSEASIVLIVSTKHRDESYKISRFIVEELKIRAPIWKKEYYINGESDWVQGHALCQHNKVDHYEGRTHSCGRKVLSHERR